MSRKFRPDQCPKCLYESRTPNVKFPTLVTRACEGIQGYSTSHTDFKGQTSRWCTDYKQTKAK